MTGDRGRVRGFLTDLRRRKVFRAGVLYVVVAAGVIELADIAIPYTRLPEVTVGVIFAVALAAFPLVLVLSWFYDITSSGLERTDPADDPADDPGDAAATAAGAIDAGEVAGPPSPPSRCACSSPTSSAPCATTPGSPPCCELWTGAGRSSPDNLN